MTDRHDGASLADVVLTEDGDTPRLADAASTLRIVEVTPESLRAETLNIAAADAVRDDDAHDVLAALAQPWESPRYRHALDGLTGLVADAVWDHSEAAMIAVASQFLVGFGNAIGRSAHQKVVETKHYGNLFAVLVGDSAHSRKGESLSYVRRIFELAAPEWATNCIYADGLASGEGLIHHVRDAQGEDEGVDDKRALIAATEFAATLKVMGRTGNTLSAVMRNLWDRGEHRNMSKGGPVRTTGAHISVIGHITLEELMRVFNATDAFNGFANRYQWFLVSRSKERPLATPVPEPEILRIASAVQSRIEFAQTVGLMKRDADADALWCAEYSRLTADHDGMFGAVTARADAQVLRLSTLYALLDGSDTIRPPHLRSAIAMWSISEDSARLIFGNRSGDSVVDRIRLAVETATNGLTITEVHRLFGRHVSADRIAAAIERLRVAGIIRIEQVRTGGRTATVLFPVRKAAR